MARQLELIKELLLDKDTVSLSDDAKKALAHSIQQHNQTLAESRITDHNLHQSYTIDEDSFVLPDSQYDESGDDILDDTAWSTSDRRSSKRVHPSAPSLTAPMSTTEVDTSEDDYGKEVVCLKWPPISR